MMGLKQVTEPCLRGVRVPVRLILEDNHKRSGQ